MRAALLLALLFLPACGPDFARISNELRDQNLKLERENATLKEQLANREASVRNLQSQINMMTPRVTTLPEDRLANLFTAGKLQIRTATNADDFDNDGTQDGFRIFIRTLTEDGDLLPATGTLKIEAFDLADKETRLGTWTFTPEQMKKNYYAGFGLNHFAFNCPWAKKPAHSDITIKAELVDALTNRTLTAQTVITAKLK